MNRFKWIIASVLFVFFVWRIIVVNMAEYLGAQNDVSALKWRYSTPAALLKQASEQVNFDIVSARQSAQQAAWQNPADGRAFLKLSEYFEREGKSNLAQSASKFAHVLSPKDANVQLKLGEYWAKKGDVKQALVHWSAAIDNKPVLSKTLFPVVLSIVDVPQMRLQIADELKVAPKWWDSFFVYALNNAQYEETIKALYMSRGDKVQQESRRIYIDFLLRRAAYTDAYFVWMNGLDSDLLAGLGNVNNGDFEAAMPDEGFAWRITKDPGFNVAAEPTYGQSGKLAMQISLLGGHKSNLVMRQYLLLDAGSYELTIRSRIENISAGNGLQWRLQCADITKQNLAKLQYFTGAEDWQTYASAFEVPEADCVLQELVLVIDAGLDADVNQFNGALWLDDIKIIRK
jgi:tetratricopeptide (TPR) repeat protein